jgi:diaminopimelate epimerase
MRGPAWETFLDQPFDIDGRIFTASAVSMGNPHLVLFSQEDPEGLFLERIGPELEINELFPERTNVEFARVAAIDTIDVRVWERGVGETLSCGTGACAVAVTANEAGLTPAAVNVRFRGGTLSVERRQDGDVWLGGSVAHVFDGLIDLAKLEGNSEADGRDA